MDENYSHGLLVPFVIALIIWIDWDTFVSAERRPLPFVGGATVGAAMLMLLAGTLGAELFTARISFVLMLAGVVLYFFGAKLLKLLAVPFALLILTIPIPQ
jgi:exosortase